MTHHTLLGLARGFATALLASGLLGGCYRDDAIRPDELPKLNGAYEHASAAGAVAFGAVGALAMGEGSVHHVVTPKGTTLAVDGEFDARVTTYQDQKFYFEYPVIAEITPQQMLVIRAANQARGFSLSRVQSVEVRQLDTGLTIGAIVAASVAVIGIGTLAIYAATHEATQ